MPHTRTLTKFLKNLIFAHIETLIKLYKLTLEYSSGVKMRWSKVGMGNAIGGFMKTELKFDVLCELFRVGAETELGVEPRFERVLFKLDLDNTPELKDFSPVTQEICKSAALNKSLGWGDSE